MKRRAGLVLALGLVLAQALPAGAAGTASTSRADAEIEAAATAAMVTNPPHSLALARRLADTTRDPLTRARAQWLQGEALSRSGRLEDANRLLEQTLASLSRLPPDGALRGEILLTQGWIAESSGNVTDAFGHFLKAYAILGHTADKKGEAKALQAIAGIYQDAGDNARALRYYSQASAAYHGDPVFDIASHNNVAESLRMLGRYRQAQPHYLAALALAGGQRSPLLQVDILTNLAWAELLGGEMAEASRHARSALLLAQAPDARDELPAAQGMLAMIAARRSNWTGAAALMDQAFADTDLATTSLPFLPFHEAAATIYACNGRPDLAYRHLLAFKRLDDGRRALAASTNSALMAARFDFSNQDLRITQLQANRSRLHELVLLLVLLAVALVSSLMAFGLVSLRRSRNIQRAANAELSRVNGSLEAALRAKSDFLAVTSHEIRTPLNGILGMAQVLLADRATVGPLRSRIEVINGAGEVMRSLVDDILDLSKIEAGRLAVSPTQVALHDLLLSLACLWRARAEAKGLGLVLDLGNCPSFVEEDGDRLRQVLMNLLANAVKFTEAGGITLGVAVAATAAGEEIRFEVADTGIGIAPEQQERIFQSFEQADASTSRRYGGTGLGLAISRAVATALGGRLTVESAPREGSRFTLALPLRQVGPAAGQAVPQAEGRNGGLLLVDPNPLGRRLLAKALRPHVDPVVMAETVTAALATLTGGRFSHMVMQAPPPGQEAAASLEQLVQAAVDAGTEMVVLAGPDDVIPGADRPGVLTLAKPVSAAHLLETLGLTRAHAA